MHVLVEQHGGVGQLGGDWIGCDDDSGHGVSFVFDGAWVADGPAGGSRPVRGVFGERNRALPNGEVDTRRQMRCEHRPATSIGGGSTQATRPLGKPVAAGVVDVGLSILY